MGGRGIDGGHDVLVWVLGQVMVCGLGRRVGLNLIACQVSGLGYSCPSKE